MTTDYPCECKHKKTVHRGGTYWCLVCDCKRYTPDIQRAANVPPVMPGGESTSVLLRQAQTALAASQADLTRVEQELNELTAEVERLVDLGSKAMRERDEARAAGEFAVRALGRAHQQRDSARAELASALAELEQLRAATNTHRIEGGTA